MPSSLTIGWIGTGIMGEAMCGHLIDKTLNNKDSAENVGKVLVHNRTVDKTEKLVKKGAIVSEPKEIAKEADVLFLMLGYPKDVEELMLGEGGLLQLMKAGAVLVDHTTSSPALARKIDEQAQKKGVSSIDAPVSGGDTGAKAGRVVVMAGGDQKGWDTVCPLISTYSHNFKLLGKAGFGQHTKMMNQIAIAGGMIGLCESLLYGYSADMPVDQVLEIISGGAAQSFSLCNLGPRILKKDFAPGFYIEHFVKDLGIALSESQSMGLKLPGLELVHSLYSKLSTELGHGRSGTQALIKALEELNNKSFTK